jgi:hypothetical protein
MVERWRRGERREEKNSKKPFRVFYWVEEYRREFL